MKVSLNWVRQFTEVDISIDELVEKIGAQLGAVEEVTDLGKKYQNILVAKIIGCEKHPNADKLSICWIDDGGVTENIERNEQGLVQVVCGAPNVREGLLVAWLPPGSTVPNSFDKDPFVLGARELRGVVSNGMLASASELAIGDDHDGIVELELDVPTGSSFAESYGLDDYIIDIENKMFTHRPDCFGILGVAREIAGIQHKQFTSPDWYREALDRIKPGKTKLPLMVKNELSELVPRFMAIAMADVTVKPSPFVLQTYLARVGLRPINNIVDITNYVMYLTGQPTHAYDADKLEGYGALTLETRLSRKGDKLRLLNGKDIEMKDDSSVLITSNDVPVGIAGVMGGADTEVDESTKNIVIECANFDMYSVRRTGMKYGLFTDALTRFNKGQSKLQNERVLEETVELVQSLATAHVASDVHDLHVDLTSMQSIKTTAEFINQRLGSELSTDDIASLLRNVECIVHVQDHQIIVEPPFWRTDLEISEDIVEEVGRLYGYDRLPLVLPKRDLSPVTQNQVLELKRRLRTTLAKAGANEVLTYGFVHGNLIKNIGQDPENAFKLTNAISPDLQYFRMSLTPSLLEKVHPNIKAGFPEFALFELGKTHGKSDVADDGLPNEFDRLAMVIAKDKKIAGDDQVAYYQAKYYVEYLLNVKREQLRYVALSEMEPLNHKMFDQLCAPFEPVRSAAIYHNQTLLGVVGEYKQQISRSMKLPAYAAGFELFLTPMLKLDATSEYVVASRFPKTEQDITLKVPTDTEYQKVEQLVAEKLNGKTSLLSKIEPISIFQRENVVDTKQITFRITLSSYDKTLLTDEVNKILQEIADEAAQVVRAERV